MANKDAITAEYVRSILHYDPETGVFTWRDRPREHFKTIKSCRTWNTRYAGTVAGGMASSGYLQIKINAASYRAHRLAVFVMTDEWPKDMVDHIDMDKANNRWENIREATRSQNMANTVARKHSKSGIKGVCWHKQHRKWVAQLGGEHGRGFICLSDCPAAASFAYQIEADKHHGEFARVA